MKKIIIDKGVSYLYHAEGGVRRVRHEVDPVEVFINGRKVWDKETVKFK